MRYRRSFVRTTLSPMLFGVVIGAGLMVVGLRAAGVPIEPGLTTPAFQKFYSAYRDLSLRYYRSVPSAKLLNGAIKGMTQSLGDPFTDYFTPSAATQFQNMLSGSFDGIGVMIEQQAGALQVMQVFHGSPAEHAGLKVGDRIVQVNGKSIVGMPVDEATSLILGPDGSVVHLGIRRASTGNRIVQFAVKRAKVTAPTVYDKMLPNRTGYLQITVVGSNTAAEFSRAWQELLKRGAKRIILDLRGNPGGYLDQAVAIGNKLIAKGQIIVQTQGRGNVPADVTKSAGPGTKVPIVVLVDANTASAAEILTAALHDDNDAPVVGTHTYGKGTVQITDMYGDGSGLKYTIARWLTPTGTWIEHKGVQPTVKATLPAFASLPPITTAHLPLQFNQNNSDVAALQQMLLALKYAVDRQDGYFDASTKLAVQAFQRSAHLPVSGTVDRATAQMLQTRFDARLASDDTQLRKAEQIADTLR